MQKAVKDKKEGTVQLTVRVPKTLLLECKKLVYEHMYKNDKRDGVVFKTIEMNPQMTLNQIRYLLEKEQISISNAGIMKIAKWCSLPYKKGK
jgi:hypothetical protein